MFTVVTSTRPNLFLLFSGVMVVFYSLTPSLCLSPLLHLVVRKDWICFLFVPPLYYPRAIGQFTPYSTAQFLKSKAMIDSGFENFIERAKELGLATF